MTALVFDVLDMGGDVRIKVNPAEAGTIFVVVGAQVDGHPATFAHQPLQVEDQRPPNAPALVLRVNDQRVKLPGVTVVFANAADPTQNHPLRVNGNAADPVRP